MTTFCSSREGETFNAWETFVVITCYKCGMPFGVPTHWRNKRMEDQETFHCPNGHSQHYTRSEVQRLRTELDKQRRKTELAQADAIQARNQRDRSRKAHRRMRDRVRNGVCPCCNRTFQNLLRHMRTKHKAVTDAELLRQLREINGMTQADLAEELGVTQNHVSAFENERTVTTWAKDQLAAWIEEFGD